MPVISAGLLPYRCGAAGIEVLLVHPGGPFWAKKDAGAWSIAKGEVQAGESSLDAAIREFTEETGHIPRGPFEALEPLKQPSGKIVHAWATEEDWDAASFVSNTFAIEWPQHSGRMRTFPEVDRIAWFTLDVARTKILVGQRGFLAALEKHLRSKRDAE